MSTINTQVIHFFFQPIRNLQFFFAKRFRAQNLPQLIFKFKAYVKYGFLMAGKKLTNRVCNCNLENLVFNNEIVDACVPNNGPGTKSA